MKLIPVVDLMHAHVVTAKLGTRDAYAPSDTPLCRSSLPDEVVSALLALYPFDTLYIADLDAIRGEGSNIELIGRLSHDHPDITFWVDNGLAELDRLSQFARPVLGAESIINSEQLAHLIASLPSPVLSLDYQDQRPLGPEALYQQPELWPQDVIAMTLSRVGSDAGPDLPRLRALSSLRTNLRLYAAGGVRCLQDLEQLRSIGVAGALLSSALHRRAIDGNAIGRFLNA